MKKFKLLLGLSIILSFIMICLNGTIVHAQGNGVVVTQKMIGNNNTTQTVRITNKVISIEDGAFSGLTALKQIIVDSDNLYYASCNGCLYNKDYTILMCVPRNITSVQIKKSVKSYTPHALDGLSQSRKNTLDKYLGKTVSTTNSSAISNTATNNTSNNTQSNNTLSVTNSSTVNNKTTDFSKYVYKENGYVCFKYTGSGDSHIIVPEGVEWIRGFTDSALKFNTDITSIELPSTLKKMSMYCMFGSVDRDTNWYNCLYQCKNLRSVTGSSSGYTGKGSTVVRPIGKIMVWSSNSRIPYDESKYTPYY